MKKFKLNAAVLPFIITAALFISGCPHANLDTELPPDPVPEMAAGEGLLVLSLTGVNVGAPARTMLPPDPLFTRYELVYSSSNLSITDAVIPFYNSTLQLALTAATDYSFTVRGYDGDKLVAQSEEKSNIDIPSATIYNETFTLSPYMDTATTDPVPGGLNFSLSWDGLSRMPYQAVLLVEQYAKADGSPVPPTEQPISHSQIPPELTQGPDPGTILLLQRDTAFVNLTGSLTLPPGEYRVTMSVTMDQGTPSVGRMDYAHIYSNLTTPAAFYYGGGDLLISNTSPDQGVSFITGFTFTETPNATTVIGSQPGTDGTRLIMIMVPPNKDLKDLTPVVTCATGSVITSPVPATQPTRDAPNPGYTKGQIDFTHPTIWTAQAKNGAVQQYTVVVSETPAAPAEKRITYFFFKEFPAYPAIIDQTQGTINVVVPSGTKNGSSPYYNFIPVISFVGTKVVTDDDSNTTDGETQLNCDGTDSAADYESNSAPILRVYASDNSSKDYVVFVLEAENTDAKITSFAFDGYPDAIANDPGTAENFVDNSSLDGAIQVTLPYGVSLKNLKPLINYVGKSVDPDSGVIQNFSGPVNYTVTAWDDSTTKDYKVTVKNKPANTNTGIFDFRVTNVPNAKVVIGEKPRSDGKIPIVIQVPFGTDEYHMIAAITLSSPTTSTIDPGSGPINFGSAGNYQEAVYTVTAQDNITTQQYVAVVSEGPQYYYVDGTNGRDNWPDVYNGGSESHPFKTLAYAVSKAATDGISKIFIKGDLTADSQTGDYAKPPNPDSANAFTINGTGDPSQKITITSVNGSTLRGVNGKRVLAIKGKANLVFENINITGGNTTGDGGGIHISGNSTVKFTNGNITGNTASNGGGVYIEDATDVSPGSEFTLEGGEISGNKATGAVADNASGWGTSPTTSAKMSGGGGVYVNGKALFWLASGTISNNTATKGAGGGVLVNGSNHNGIEEGFLMSGGRITGNKTTSTTYPHGGGGVYVAHGAFEMLGGEVTGNNANRQGGGVFVHWGAARFTASGNSSITGNDGVGSSKAICNRGITEMMGNARADRVYIWDYDEDSYVEQTDPKQSFTLAQGAQVTGLVLAYSAHDESYVTIASTNHWDGPVCTIDLESRLINGFLHGPISDWYNHKIIYGNTSTLTDDLKRLPLNSFTGEPSVSNMGATYEIKVSGTGDVYGTFAQK